MKYIEKQKAKILRGKGLSLKEIAKKLKVAKASVSLWVRNVELDERQRRELSKKGSNLDVVEKRRLSRINNEKNKRNTVVLEAMKDINSVSEKELKIIGAMLYWAEGRKRGQRTISFSNSDPEMIKIIMRFFRVVCLVPESKFRGHIHIHSHLNVESAENYWSKISQIPLSQFYKTYSKPSISSLGKMDSLPNGTFDVCVNDVILFLKIMGWIKKINELTLKI